MVYVARNPKDVIVSFFYHHKLMKLHNYTGDIEQFAQYFMDNECKDIVYEVINVELLLNWFLYFQYCFHPISLMFSMLGANEIILICYFSFTKI